MVEAKQERSVAIVNFVLLIVAYLSLNSSLNVRVPLLFKHSESPTLAAHSTIFTDHVPIPPLQLLNKWALGHYGLRFPFMLTCTHMLFSFIVLSPFALRVDYETHVKTLQKQWKGILYIGAFMALNIALNNLSLLDISLTLNQIIRSAIPVVTCVLAIIVESKMPTQQEATSLIILTLGVMLAVWQGTVTGKPYAIALCIIGTICNGAMMTFSGKLLSEKLDVVRLTFYAAPVSLTCLAPFYFMYEKDRFAEYYQEHSDGVVVILIASSINAVLYNLVHSAMIKRTSAVTTTVLGEVKIVGLLILSAFLLGEKKEFTFTMTLGCLLAMIGFFMYSQTKIQSIRSSTSVNTKVISLEDNGDEDGVPLLGIQRDNNNASMRGNDIGNKQDSV